VTREQSPVPVRDDLKDLHPYGAPQLDVPVQLNTNENPYAPSQALQNAIAEAVAGVAGTLNRYPDRDATELRKDLADYLGHGVTAASTWAANGSNEIIQQLLQAFGGPGRTALGFEPSYSMHPLISKVTCTEWLAGARDADYGMSTAAEQVRQHQPDIVFVTSPNNPTGTSVPLDLTKDVYDAAPGMVVVDEAYAEFRRDGTPSALTLLPGRPRLVVCRTERDALVNWLRENGLTVADSDANFVLFGVFGDRDAVWQGLLDRGVLIRNTGPDGWLRVTVGTAEETAAFRAALTEVLDL